MITSSAISMATPLSVILTDDGDESADVPDTGFIFVYHADGRQVFTADNKEVQVPIALANS